MGCSCRKGKKLSSVSSEKVDKLISLLKENPAAFDLILELVNSFRPTDEPQTRVERVFLAVKDMCELGLVSYGSASLVLEVLNDFFVKGKDKLRGDFLEVLLSKLGPLSFRGPFRRVNQCRVFRDGKKLSNKEIDVAFSGKEVLELHECKVNMIRQWRGSLSRRSKKGKKLDFLNTLPEECSNGKKVVVFCTGLEGRLGVDFVAFLFNRAGFSKIVVAGREEILKKFKERLGCCSEIEKKPESF